MRSMRSLDKRERVDSNQLIALDALLRERSVTRAAAAVGIGQPGMSHALQRLRAHFGDALLVRGEGGLALTPRASALVEPVRHAVAALDQVFAVSRPFDPRRSTRLIRLAATDHVGCILLPPFLRILQEEAPGMDLDVMPVTAGPSANPLASGAIDLALGVFPDLPAAIRRQHLFDDRFVCLVRKDHPVVRRGLTLKRYLSLTHILVAPRGTREGKVDVLLRARKLERRIGVTVPHFLLAPLLAARSDCVVTMTERLARCFEQMLDVRVLEPPLPLPPYDLVQIWHERNQNDSAHRWVRQALFRAARQIPPLRGKPRVRGSLPATQRGARSGRSSTTALHVTM
jgi:DNA-binding transcriptional LysR family regulator